MNIERLLFNPVRGAEIRVVWFGRGVNEADPGLARFGTGRVFLLENEERGDDQM